MTKLENEMAGALEYLTGCVFIPRDARSGPRPRICATAYQVEGAMKQAETALAHFRLKRSGGVRTCKS